MVRGTYRCDCVGKIGCIGDVVHAEIEVAEEEKSVNAIGVRTSRSAYITISS